MRRPREFSSKGPEETEALGQRLGEQLQGGEVVLLFGPLGAGKTVFVKGIARGLGIASDSVRSPSYTLINEHAGDAVTFYHVDLYRLTSDSLRDLGLEDLYGDRRVVAVEWAERLEEAGWDLGDAIIVEIDHMPGDGDTRMIVVDDGGALALDT